MCLEDRGVTEATRERYSKAVHEVLPWIENSQLNLEGAVSEWIEVSYARGEGITKISDHYLPWCRGKLSKPWRLLERTACCVSNNLEHVRGVAGGYLSP